MRLILFLLIAGFFNCKLAAQDGNTKRPAQKEMQAQMLEAGNEARQQVSDLKKQIAEAKLNKEDPETIKELEKQLVVLEQMLTIIDKARPVSNPGSKTLTPSNTVEPRYSSPFIPITLKQPVAIPTKEQARDTLLWYTGRRIDANTLITTSGMLVRYDRVSNRLLLQPDRKVDTTYYGLLNTLSQTERTKNTFAYEAERIKNSFFMYPEIVKAYEEFDYFRERYDLILKNSINLPVFASALTGTPNSNPPPANSNIIQRDLVLEELYFDLKNSIADLENKLINGLEIIPPPERPELCRCDRQRKLQYKNELLEWLKNLFHDEKQVLIQYQEIFQHLEKKRSLGITDLVPSDLNAVLDKALGLYIEVRSQKIWEITKLYREEKRIYIEDGLVGAVVHFNKFLRDFDAKDAGAGTAVSVARQRIQWVKDLLFRTKVFENYMEQQKNIRNYNAVYDYALHISHENNKKALDPSYQIMLSDVWWSNLRVFNRFKLTIAIDFEYNQVDVARPNEILLSASGLLESKEMAVSIGSDHMDLCKWKLYLTEQNHRRTGGSINEELFKIPFKVQQGMKVFNKKTHSYTGPDSIRMMFPTIKVGFCDQTPDSVILDVMSYHSRDLQIHRNDKADEKYSVDMLFYVNKLFLSSEEIRDNISDVLANVAKAVNLNTRGISPPTANRNPYLEKLYQEYSAHLEKDEILLDRTASAHTANTIILFQAKNGDLGFNIDPHDATDNNDPDKANFGIFLKRGLIIVKIIHDPQ